MRRGWLAGLVLAGLGGLAGFAVWRSVEAGCNELSIWKTDPYEETDCYSCEDHVSGLIWNEGITQLTCVYLIYDDDDNIAEGDGYPELWIDNELTPCAFVPPMQSGVPGKSLISIYSQRNDWTQSAQMKVAISFPCLPPFTKYFMATWVDTCPYCN